MSEKIMVEKTYDYGMFKILEGNREVRHYQKILDSIRTYGFFMNPILVNERYEIIDGQGRFLSLQKLGLPIYYIKQPGIGLDECRVLNIQQTNWTCRDFVNSYASEDKSYDFLKKLLDKYGEYMNTRTICFLSKGGYTFRCNGSSEKNIRNGGFTMTETEYKAAIKKLNFLTSFSGFVGKVAGFTHNLWAALAFAYDCPSVDNSVLKTQVERYGTSLIKGVTGMDDAVSQVSELLNYSRGRRKKIDLLALYKERKKV